MSATETIVESGGAPRVRLSRQSPAATLVGGLPLGEDLPPPVTRDAGVAHAPNRNHGLSLTISSVTFNYLLPDQVADVHLFLLLL